MAYLVGSADKSAYVTTYTRPANSFSWWHNNTAGNGIVPNESGIATTLELYFESFTPNASIYAIYEDDLLVDYGPVSSESIEINVVIDVTKKYDTQLLSNSASLVWFRDTSDSAWYYDGAAASTPDAVISSGNFSSGNGFYWALTSTSSSVTAPSNATFGDTMTISTSGLSTLTTATFEDSNSNVFNITVTNNTTLDVPAIAAALDACLYGTVTLTVGDGIKTAATTLDFDPPDGYTLTEIQSLGGLPSFTSQWAVPAEIGDQIIIPSGSRATFNSDESFSATGDTAFSFVSYTTSKTGGEITQVPYNFLGEVIGSTYGIINLVISDILSDILH